MYYANAALNMMLVNRTFYAPPERSNAITYDCGVSATYEALLRCQRESKTHLKGILMLGRVPSTWKGGM